MSEHTKPRKYDPLQVSPALLRADYCCQIARDRLSGDQSPLPGFSTTEAALYSLASALQDIAMHLMDEKALALQRAEQADDASDPTKRQ
jgi:phage gp36-like protein